MSTPEYKKKWFREKYHKNAVYRAKHNENTSRRFRELRVEFLEEYGKSCACCGESHPEFLTAEHSFRDGKEHREKVGGGYGIYLDLKRRGWPKDIGIIVLCYNCNLATKHGRLCPHKGGRWIFPK